PGTTAGGAPDARADGGVAECCLFACAVAVADQSGMSHAAVPGGRVEAVAGDDVCGAGAGGRPVAAAAEIDGEGANDREGGLPECWRRVRGDRGASGEPEERADVQRRGAR